MTLLIDRLSEIDNQWRQGCPVTPVELFQANCASLSELELAEVLAADSEWRWRRAGFLAQPVNDIGIPWDDLRPRTAEVYWREFPQLAKNVQSQLRFVEAEFMARSRWGNPPLIREFSTRFDEIRNIADHLLTLLEEISQLVVARQQETTPDSPTQLCYVVRSPLSIGRQAANEPRDEFVLEEGQRLIIANNYEHGVSRKHAVLWRQSVDKCLVENTSPLGEMRVNGGLFPPGWSQLILLPLTIEIANRRLKIFLR